MNTWGVWEKVRMTAAATAVAVCLLLFVRWGGNEKGNKVKTAALKSSQLPSDATVLGAYGRLPLRFEENQGQTAKEVRFLSHGASFALFLTESEAVLTLRQKGLDLSPQHRAQYYQELRRMQLQHAAAAKATTVRLQFDNANPNPKITGVDRQITKVNYFVGSDPKNWHTNVPSFGRVKYSEIYPGIDLVFYGNRRKLEYDFVVSPGADPSTISMKIAGADGMKVNPQGDLVLTVTGGEVVLQKPLVYQTRNGRQHEISAAYVLRRNGKVGLALAAYDRSEPLILDPVLDYSTYLGGSGTEDSVPAGGIAVDAAGDAFVAGQTTSTDFPSAPKGGVSTLPAGANSGVSYVAELDPTGSQLLYSTYLAGTSTSAGDSALSLALDSTGKAYVTGATFAAGFPSVSPLTSFVANTSLGTCYVAKLDTTQNGTSSLLFSSYIGGTNGDFCFGIAADSGGNAYITGYTFSTDYPASTGFLTTAPSGVANGTSFISRINTTSSTLVYSSYLGGNGALVANGIGLTVSEFGSSAAVDSSNVAYIVGTTASTNFPTAGNAVQTSIPATNLANAAFISKIDTTKTGAASLVYSTYLSGSGQFGESGRGVGLGPSNRIYVTGTTNSTDFPTAGASLSLTSTAGDAFVTILDSAVATPGSTLIYSTYLGGGGGDDGNAISADANGNAYVAGIASSPNFPVTPGAFQVTRLNPSGAAFVAKINPNGTDQPANPLPANPILVYSTFFGGSGAPNESDQALGLAIDSANPPNVYITGETGSADLPIQGPLACCKSLNGTTDAYVAKLSLIPTLSVAPATGSTVATINFGTVQIGTTSAAQTVTLTNNTSSNIPFTSAALSGANMADYTATPAGCSPNIVVGTPCVVSITFKPTAPPATEVATLTITDGDSTSPQVYNLTGTGATSAPGVGFAPTSLTFGNQQQGTTSAAQPVTLTNTGSAALTINTIAASGDFAATSTGATACPISPATLAAGANCTINVTFTPTATGTRNGTLSVTDNAGGSPQMVSLTGTGTPAATPDFTLTAAPTSVTVAQGAVSAPVTITVNPTNGFSSSVSLTCSGAPAKSSCSLSPTSTTTTSSLTFTAHAMLVPLPVSRPAPPVSPLRILPLIVALAMVLLLRSAQRFRSRAAIISAILLCLTLAACGSSGSNNNTAKGTYTLTITGTSGTLSHNATVSVTVD